MFKWLHKSKNITIAIITIIVIATIYIFSPTILSFVNNQTSFNLSGKLYVTVVDKDGTRLNVETLSLKDKTLNRLVVNKNRNMTASLYKKNGSIVFSSRPIESKKPTQLFILDTKNNIKQITKNGTYIKTYPKFSPDGKSIVYMALNNFKNSTTIPNNWSVYKVDLNGKEKFVTTGEYPVFSPDGGSIVVLKNKGLYIVDLLNGSSRKVWGINDGKALSDMSFTISNDKSKLAWVNPYGNRVYIYSIRSWSPFAMSMKLEINETAIHPVFSPDSDFLALEKVVLNEKNYTIKNASIIVYNLNSSRLQKMNVFELSNKHLQNVSISDWQ